MLCLSVMMIHSAAMTLSSDDYSQGSLSVTRMLGSRHTYHALAAMVVMFFASFLDIREIVLRKGFLGNPLVWVFGVSVVLLLLTYTGIGVEKNASTRWLKFGGVSVQPSELVKWLLIPMIAWWVSKRWAVMGEFRAGLLPILILVGGVCGLVAMADLGTGILIACVCGLLLLAGGARWWQLFLCSLPGLGGVYLLISAKAYRLERLKSFMAPWDHMEGSGYQLSQGLLGIAEGGISGRGIGRGIQKFYTPEDTTDFIFAPICEEIGLFGCLIVVLMFLTLLFMGLGIVKRCEDVFGRLLGLGIVLMLCVQGLMNLMVVTGLMPTTGIALPFISSGGTGWLITGFMVGILASLDNAAHFEGLREAEAE